MNYSYEESLTLARIVCSGRDFVDGTIAWVEHFGNDHEALAAVGPSFLRFLMAKNLARSAEETRVLAKAIACMPRLLMTLAGHLQENAGENGIEMTR